MADVRRLDGTVVDTAKLGRNERIGNLLDDLVQKNDRGELAAIIAVTLTPQATHGVHWQLPMEDFGYPWGLALRGALVLAQSTISSTEVFVPDTPDGA